MNQCSFFEYRNNLTLQNTAVFLQVFWFKALSHWRIVLAYASVSKISLIRRYTLTYGRGRLGKDFIRFKHGRVRRHTAKQKFFLSMLKNFVRIRTYGLYDKHTLGTRLSTLEVRQMYGTHTLAFQRIFVHMKIISLIFNFHTLLIRFSHTQ